MRAMGSRPRPGLPALAVLLALCASTLPLYPEFVGGEGAITFSLCEEADDGGGEPRLECQASDIRFQAAAAPATDFGFSLAAGRLDGDDLADVVVGDPARNRVYVFYGRGSATAAYGLAEEALDRGVDPEAVADVILEPSAAVGSFGFSVAVGRPVEAIGCGTEELAAPLLVGAPGQPGVPGAPAGSAFYLPPGSLCQPVTDPASPVVLDPGAIGQEFQAAAPAADDEFGYSVATGRLLSTSTEEGEDDVVVGARNAAAGSGRVSIFPVSGGVVLTDPLGDVVLESAAGDGLGEVLAVGDLDLDFEETEVPFGDRDDLAVGAVGHVNGKVLLVQGPLAPDGGAAGDGLYREDADVELQAIVGERPGDFFGFSVAATAAGNLLVGAFSADNLADGDAATNVPGVIRSNAGKAYLWRPGIYDLGAPDASAAGADVVVVGRRAADQLGFAVGFGDLDGSGGSHPVISARREDGTGLTLNEIDQGTVYISLTPDLLLSPADLGDCAGAPDCAGAGGFDVLIYGGDREEGLGNELGFALATANFNGDLSDDIVVSSATHRRVYLVTLEDTDGDRDVAGRNIRDEDDDADGDPDATDCDRLDPEVNAEAEEIQCNGIDDNCNGMEDDAPDEDGDGFDACGDEEAEIEPDCDDGDPDSFPGAPEACDGNDNDCDGAVPDDEEDADGDTFAACDGWVDTQDDNPEIAGGGDCDDGDDDTFPGAAPNEADPLGCYSDSDGDGWGDLVPALGVTAGSDCNDALADAFPGAAELDSPTDCMLDADGDGFGDDSANAPVVDGTDCDDDDPAAFPGAPELCDGNNNACTGAVPDDETDEDGDLYVACDGWDDTQGDDPGILGGGDCAGSDADAYPGAAENELVPDVCFRDADGDGYGELDPADGIPAGSDCDDLSDVTFPGAAPLDAPFNCMKDADDDDFGDDAATLPVVAGSDCDDDDALTFAGAAEIPDDDVDQNCNGFDTVTCFEDLDGDGVGGTATLLSADGDCNEAGESDLDTDCDETDPAIFPGQSEIPGDGIDQDCNGTDAVTCFVDADRDGFGDGGGATVDAPDGSCDAADGESDNTDDCDDGDATTFPGAAQQCDGNDNTCGGVVPGDEVDVDGDGYVACSGWSDPQGDDPDVAGGGDCDESAIDTFPGAGFNEPFASACMRDADGDGYGDGAALPPVSPGTDCDDSPAGGDTFPGAASIDGPLNCMKDADGDEYGDASASLPVVPGTDCDDDSASAAVTFPGAAVAETDPAACHKDLDGDGYGDAAPPAGVQPGSDCDDDSTGASSSFPGAPELCDGNDNDCSGDVPAEETDGDGDLWVACSGWDDLQGDDPGVLGGDDCDDGSALTFPGAAVAEDAPDQCMRDGDGDGYGDSAAIDPVIPGTDCDDASDRTFPGAASLDVPAGACMRDGDEDGYGDELAVAPVTAGADCDDTDASSFPDATEVPLDGIDQDCDGADSMVCFEDLDGDGFGTTTTLPALDADCTDPGESPFDTDCDDTDIDINPDAVEIADDGTDQDCNGTDTITCVADADQDTFGSILGTPALAPDGSCDTEDGESTTADDCDDSDPGAFPGALETPDDGIDQDCNGADTITCILDADSDGFGTLDGTVVLADDGSCDAEEAESTSSDDCDDNFASVYPGAPETPDDGLDQDCSGADTITCTLDGDQDGFGTDLGTAVLADDGRCDADQGESDTSDDCDDADPGTFPGAAEVPGDGLDQDCSGEDSLDCFVDNDRDGFGTVATVPSADADCADPGESQLSTDCDDALPAIFPGATEIPDDGVDQDCNGEDTITCFVDADGDGFGSDAGDTVLAGDGACDAEDGESTTSDDCDDASALTFPGASEILDDGIDQDCSGTDSITCFLDADGDGAGTDAGTLVVADDGTCDRSQNESPTRDDCDDADPARSPTAVEIPGDGIDQDCDGVDSFECFLDSDGDGFGGTLTVTSTDEDCSDPGESSVSTDCDDGNGAAFPGAAEVLEDGIDQDCNGFDSITCFLDADRDGFGTDLGTTVVAPDASCDTTQREATNTDDCDDGSSAVFPGATEIADDGIDQDCSGVDTITCFVDGDGDGFGNMDGVTVLAPDGSCDQVEGESETGDDCDDADATIFPGAAELPLDGIDQDCNGVDAETCFEDLDGDGFGNTTTLVPDDMDCTDPGESPFDTDCDDDDDTVFPDADEVVDDGLDQDCNGTDTITCFVDLDGDGAGDPLGTTLLAEDGSCDAEEGESSTSDDCDEADPDTFPGAPELCDGNANTCVGDVPADEIDSDGDGYVGCVGWNDTQGDDPGVLGGNDCGADDPLTYPGIAFNDVPAGACRTDQDGDGFGDLTPPAGVTPGTDCDDSDADTFLGAASEAPVNCMRDRDDDGFGDSAVSLPIVAGTDCDDGNPDIFPGAPEQCDGNDSSCNGIVPSDERDLDGDGYVACVDWDDVQGDDPQILGGGDCIPGDGTTFPGAAPAEAFPDACMQDADGDDFGDLVPPAGALPGTDCDDGHAGTFPGAAPNEAFGGACMRDDDGDDFGDAAATLPVVAGTDCDDGDATRFPGAPEVCGDMVDSDCDGDDPPCEEDVAVFWLDRLTLTWSLPAEMTGPSDVYRGDLGVLRTTGVYTQAPLMHPAAARLCDAARTTVQERFLPARGECAFYLISAQTSSGESSLGRDSAGRTRPNTRPCP